MSVNQYYWSTTIDNQLTPWWTLNQYLNQHSVDTTLTLDWHLDILIDTWLRLNPQPVDSWSGCVNWLIHVYIDWHLMASTIISWLLPYCQPRCWLSVDRVSIEMLLECWSRCWSIVKWGYRSTRDCRCL